MILAVVPARGGSKGIPRKNLMRINDKTLIEHAVESSPYKTIITTDDDDIYALAKRLKVMAVKTTPGYLHSDECSSLDVWRHAWYTAEEKTGKEFKASILLEPTSPMREEKDIEETVKALGSFNGESCAATVQPTKITPHKIFKINQEDALYCEDFLPRRQDAPPYFVVNGACYAMTRKYMESGKEIFDLCRPVITRHIISIDDWIDLEYCRFLMTNQPQALSSQF